MKCKKILGLLMVAVLVSSIFAVFGNSPASADDQFVDHIRLEVRMEQGVGVGDTATGVLDAFLQAVEGPIYAEVRDDWKAQLTVLNSYGSYNNMYYNTATTGGYAEVDTTGDGNLDYFNPWNIREIRYATNWLINRQMVVEDIYDGYGIAMYAAIGQRNPAYEEYFAPLIEDRGITYSGDFDYANDMINDAMTDAMNHDDLEGDLRKEGDFWEYRPPGGDWMEVETHGGLRIEDRRSDIGHWFSNQLEACGIKVFRDDIDRTFVNTWLFTDASEMQWGFYTGGWIASAAVAYQHASSAQMYTPFYPYMPGDYFQKYIDPEAGYGYHRDDPAADNLYELAMPLMSGQVPDEDTYWVMFQDLTDAGIHESVRVFVQTSIDFIPLNRDAVTEVATDVVTGWSQVFSPRTIKTVDGELVAAQFSATGALYMDNWNNIAGFADYYSVLQARMSRDFATMMDPAQGIPIGMRADFEEVMRGYEYDDDGNLTKWLEVPADAVNYDVFDEEWYEVGSGVEVATAVEYKWHFGTWHSDSDHEFNMQDLVAYYAFSKQLCWLTDAGEHYYVGAMEASQPYYNNIKGIVFDEDADTITIYGDYTFPTDPQIGGYYMWMPEVPWQQYEAASQLIGLTDLAPDDTLNDQAYNWASGPGTNYIHWLSSAQGVDYDATLGILAAEDFVPPYLRADRNSPIPLSPGDADADIGLMRDFYAEYDHFWITHGPFKLVTHDPSNLVIEFERWGEDDGYPFPDDYWRDKLAVARLRLGTLSAPRKVTQGDAISLSVRARVDEEYPLRVTRDLTEGDSYTVEAALLLEGSEEFVTTDVDLTNSVFTVTISSDETENLDPGTYEARIIAEIEGQLLPAEVSAGVTIESDEDPAPPEPTPVPEGVENITLSASPTSGNAPLTVTVTVSADNHGEDDADLDVYLDASVWQTVTIPANGSASDDFTATFDDAGDYIFQIGTEYVRVEVEVEDDGNGDGNGDENGDSPGFAFVLLAVGITFAVIIYHRKKR